MRSGLLCVAAWMLILSGVQAQQPQSAFPVRYVPKHALLAVGIRPAQMLSSDTVRKLVPLFQNGRLLNPLHGVPIENVERLMISLSIIDPAIGRFHTAFILQTQEPIDQDTVIETAIPQNRVILYGGQRYRKDTDSQFRPVSVWFPDEKTLIVAEGDGAMETVIDSAAMKTPPVWHSHVKPDASVMAYENVSRGQELIEMGMEMMRQMSRNRRHATRPLMFPADPSLVVLEPFLGMFAPLWQDVDTMVWNVSVGDDMQLEVVADVEENGSVEAVEETLDAVRLLKKNAFAYLAKHDQKTNDAFSKAFSAFLQMSDDLLKTTKITREERTIRVTASWSGEKMEKTIASMVPTMIELRARSRRIQSKNNMKHLGIAMHNYHDVHGQFPPPVITGPDGKTPVSWRVAILPYIEANELHKQYHFDEPWDSEHNKKLLDQMPSVYRHPDDETESTNTSYFAIVGEKTAFGPKDGDGIRFADIFDGSSNTWMIVEAKKKVPWTKPDDIAYDPEAKKLPVFGGWYKDGFHAAFCDGAVRFIEKTLEDETVRKLIERNDGQIVEFPR
ncbi:DUF1559 family PulG-like putative transporter [Thalassoroseus pseudoceratinae]|uniref:DUF1559 family PulG-like putative transporter n=1 Tax=Thalassoroseus pseudoceratinae TaxID=2713176 RepID=UPI001422DE7F|nr:DUF1559 domain-containing protein [Thalassoroseus pseudoceratinae]